MNRRSFLQSIGVGAVLPVAGCLSGGTSGVASVAAVETRYPTLTAAQYSVLAEPAPERERDEPPIQFESLPRQARIEVANAVGRREYITTDSTVWDSDYRSVTYRGMPFTISTGVADGRRRRNPDIPEYVTLDATIAGRTLMLSLTNELHEPLAIRHGGRPYFGVLTAVGETPTLLHHGRYGERETIHTTDIVRTERFASLDRTTTIEPGHALRESYRIRDPLPDGSTIWLATYIRSDPIDLSETMTGTITIDA